MNKKFSIAVDEEKLKQLEVIAKLEERSNNWLINKAIELYLEKWIVEHPEGGIYCEAGK